ncbi:MAG: peptidase M16 [Clostridium sp.]|jgi:predicted Zn-dependent peptidase|nr:MAG: peptidase M16 [Clostridium sp.]
MREIENKNIKEKCYMEKLENGLQVIIIPKKEIQKKYIIWATKFGSIDNTFIDSTTGEKVVIPDGVAHFLEHKMFEQKNGVDSLYVLMALGLDANAYTTNDHTAYLFECTDHFYEGLDELMDYVQNPYFTDQNVEKEKGIIGQEIGMYDDDPGWQLYINAMDCLYEKNTIKVDTAGTVETISGINPEMLYKCYNTFYHPSNMVLTVAGDFEPEAILAEIKKRLKDNEVRGEITRIYPEEKLEINKKYAEKEMEVSLPLFMIGFKDNIKDKYNEVVKRHIAIEIILNMLIGKSSNLYNELYKEGYLLSQPDLEYEFGNEYSHVLIGGQSKNPQKVYEKIAEKIQEMRNNNINVQEFERIKKKIYGDYAVEYNNVADIGRMFTSDYIKGINSFEYMDKFEEIDAEYAKQVLKEIFTEDKMIMSVIKGKK